MNYIYDILLNFQDEYYDFFEWNTDDKITHIKKIPIIKITSNDLINIKNSQVIFNEDFLKQIYNKTQIFKKYDINTINYMCILCSDNSVIGISINKNGKITGKSSLLLDENEEVLEIADNLELSKIDFKIIMKQENFNFRTRKENFECKQILKKLHHLLENNEVNKLNYLCFECFGKKETDINKAFAKIKEEVYKYNDNYSKINDFLKIISQK